jgi:SRSO17 transposase
VIDESQTCFIVAETGFLNKYEKSVEVAHQYTGTTAETVNCQVGVFLAYASEKDAAFVEANNKSF